MVLTAEQLAAVLAWAERTPCIREVRLYGSFLKGDTHPGSDLDLAVTLADTDGETGFTTYLAERRAWARELTRTTGLKPQIEPYDATLAPLVFGYCQECSQLIFVRGV